MFHNHFKVKYLYPLSCFATFFIALQLPSFCQSQWHWRVDDQLLTLSHWSVDNDQLPTWRIADFLQDSKDYVWLATSVGLVRFDGKNFKIYGVLNSSLTLCANFKLAEDINGNIWLIAPHENGKITIDVFNVKREQFQPINNYLGHSLSFSRRAAENVYRVQNKIWILDANGKGGYFDGTWHNVLQANTSERDVLQFFPAPKGNFWLWTHSNQFKLISPKGKVIKHYTLPYTSIENRLWLDEDLQIWLCHTPKPMPPTVFSRISETEIRSFPIGHCPEVKWGNTSCPRNSYVIINPFKTGFFATTAGFDLYRNDKKININLSNEIHDRIRVGINSVIFLDKQGGFWFASLKGLSKLSLKKKQFKSYLSDQMPQISCRGITYFDDHSILVNTYSGCFKFDLKTNKTENFHYPGDNIGTFFLRDKTTLWICKHYPNIIRYNLTKRSFSIINFAHAVFNRDAYALHILPDSTLMIGTSSGVFRTRGTTPLMRPTFMPDTVIHCWYKNKKGLWAGTQYGLVLFDSQGKHILRRFFDHFKQPSVVRINHILENPDGSFWIAASKGICKWQPFTKQIEWYATNVSVVESMVHYIHKDSKGYIWAPSNVGLLCLDPKTRALKTFGIKDGLPFNEFNSVSAYYDHRGQLFLGGINGLVSFYPDSIFINKKKENHLLISSVKLVKNDGQEQHLEVASHKKLRVKPNFKQFNIEVSVPGYTGEKYIFEWRNKTQDSAWQAMNTSNLQFYLLPYGLQQYEIRAKQIDHRFDQNLMVKLDVQVLRPFYLRIWFLVLLLIGLIYLSYQIIVWRSQALKRKNDLLQAMVDEKTAVIIKQIEEIKRIDEIKNRLFIDVNHQLRTPITIIQWQLNDLFQQSNDTFVFKTATQIQKNIQKLKNLANEILLLARMKKDLIELYETNFYLKSFIENVFTSFNSLARAKSINYRLNTSVDDTTLIKADRGKLEKVISNLIDNSIKYSETNSTLALYAFIEEGWVKFIVQDTGIGMNEKDLENISKRFYQASAKQATDGFGIGMSLVSDYVQLMGGFIHFESQPGIGTTATLSIPFKAIQESSLPAMSNKNTNDLKENEEDQYYDDAFSVLPLNGIQILLVEDNQEMRDHIQSFLNPLYPITIAANGAEALETLEQNHNFNLIISDIMMPQMNGFDLLKRVRSDDQFKMIPFLILSARTDVKDQMNALRLGVDGYLTKPFEKEELLARVENLLQNQLKRKTTAPSSHSFTNISPNSYVNKWLQELERVVKEHLHQNDLKVHQLATQLAVSERTLRDRIKEYTGLSPQQYILEARLLKAQELLENQVFQSVAEVSYNIGIKTPAYFTKVYKERFGKAPSDYLHSEI